MNFMNGFKQGTRQPSVEDVVKAIREFAATQKQAVERFAAFFKAQDERYAHGVRAYWGEEQDRALGRILRTKGREVVYGPPPLSTHIPDTPESIDFVAGSRIDELSDWHGRIHQQIATFSDINQGKAAQTKSIVDAAVGMLFEMELETLKAAGERMAKAKSGDELLAISDDEFEATQRTLRALSRLAGILKYANYPQFIESGADRIIALGTPERLVDALLNDDLEASVRRHPSAGVE